MQSNNKNNNQIKVEFPLTLVCPLEVETFALHLPHIHVHASCVHISHLNPYASFFPPPRTLILTPIYITNPSLCAVMMPPITRTK